ncbi:C4-dicarboxylate transporter DcuC [Parasutterella secunda]|jgi:transporter, anaerobic C4-dicarboxylate uptake C (dcuC) family|uniref:C4-dicarboxylate transporter DcuC n=1 Tax=Parasutterella secunda TaxID=626947 RepID=UPI002011B0CE|nr:C4-dicarboxylate transporter DcuC [Parasutterella secunda]MCL1595819.1 C4-dicarboxylate transporter DcuC [Parasutterella secunda]MCR8920491.1 C4-dicarboxylate transporter DcuC [Parasutterella secunda]MDM8087172.1 C4-dicarboxylate transporter DcuC [Parasutterella secunda]MDM8112555.1 C4-dicarboxylate transporter DcuC [Parasutterella secunda]MDM8224889.1 C4-dicarboxylate transporter DcuC [Parasutterella secunda]
MSLLEWLAIAVTILTVYALIKRLETRLVLFTAGFVLCLVSMDPLSALNSFAKSMTNNSLVMAICSSMGFAFIANYTQCDRSLVHYLAAPIRGLGVFLIPICTAVTFFINIAIPSAAGCAAAVGSTLIPVMLRAGIKPAAAAAAVMGGTIGSYLSPGTSHNPFVAEMAGIDVMDFIAFHAMWSILCGVILVVGLLVVCMFLGDHKGEKVDVEAQKNDNFKPNPIKAIMPLVPITILVVGNVWLPVIKMGVAQAMVLGAVITLLVGFAFDRTNPQEFSKQFFNGMGKGYADVMGIIIAAGVFAAGLRATGLIDTFVDVLKHSNDIARWGGSLGPWIMGTITGSGDAATMAFNEAVTPHAPEFGMEIKALGALAFLTGALGRTMSPIAGAMVVVAGIAMANPMDVAKRTALPCTVAVFVLALFMV